MDDIYIENIFDDALDLPDGVPRTLHIREDKVNTLNPLSFQKKVILSKQITLYVLSLIEPQIKFPFSLKV